MEMFLPAARAQPERLHSAPDVSVIIPTFNERENVGKLVSHLIATLHGLNWEVIFVDDDSPDRTVEVLRDIGHYEPRIRCIRRVGRRGLAGACIEGILSAQGEIVAVMDADLQHDHRLLPDLVAAIRDGNDLAIATRYSAPRQETALSPFRSAMSRIGTFLAQRLITARTTDPMSGFFATRRDLVEVMAPRLSNGGFKILFDILSNAEPDVRIAELPYRFATRSAGRSKMDRRVALQFLGLLFTKATRGLVSLRLVSFFLIGAAGLGLHMALLILVLVAGVNFAAAQAVATLITMIVNFSGNNLLTYHDQQLRGRGFFRGLLVYVAICGIGAVVNVGIATALFTVAGPWWVAGLAGAFVSGLWNYLVTQTLVWNRPGAL